LFFKFALTGVHLTWLVVNVAIFVQFVMTTLHFVEPRARERLRERYTANIITPRDLSVRLSRVFYMNAPSQLLPEPAGAMGPPATFGYDLSNALVTEVQTRLARPSILRDVWLKPLGWVVQNWWRQTQRIGRSPRAQSRMRVIRRNRAERLFCAEK
jgi:hypothetical protein